MPRTVKLAAVRGKCVLLVYKGATRQWSLPGGKVNAKEKDIKCVRRELSEELPRLRAKELSRWRRFNFCVGSERFAITIYFGKVSGQLTTDKEIDAAAWIRHHERVPLSTNTNRIFKRLIADGYLKR